MRGLAVLLVLVFACGGSAAADATLLGDASISYRALRTVTVDGRSYSGTVCHRPGQDRHEQEIAGIPEFILLNAASSRGFVVVPGLSTYVEFAFPRLMAELGDPRLRRAPVGQEVVNGVRTTKYRIDYTAGDGSRARGFAWVGAEGVLMRLDGTVDRPGAARPMAIRMELSELRPGPQDPALFELPAGFVKLSPSALAPLLGGKPR